MEEEEGERGMEGLCGRGRGERNGMAVGRRGRKQKRRDRQADWDKGGGGGGGQLNVFSSAEDIVDKK